MFNLFYLKYVLNAKNTKQRYLGRREMAKYLGRGEKGLKKIREKGDEKPGDMGPFNLPPFKHLI